MKPDTSADSTEFEGQSRLCDDDILCEQCAPDSRKPTPQLEKTDEAIDEVAYFEYYECPGCGATGWIEQRHDSGIVLLNGCVTTPKRIDMARREVWARSRRW
jgi:uncharacterized protein with PIN domain